MNSPEAINYHFMIDDKFIDDFIKDADSICLNNKYIFTFSPPSKYVKSNKGIFAPYHSKELDFILGEIRKEDRVFVHWYSPKINAVIQNIPMETKVYLFFWGADFLESPSFSHTNNPINRFLYDPLTLAVFSKKSIEEQYKFRRTRNVKALESKNLKNIIATHWSNFLMQWNTFSKRNYSHGMLERQAFLQRIEAICHWNNYDIQILEELYKVRLKQKYFVYNVGTDQINRPIHNSTKKTLTIWLGNSDTETNNHLDFLAKLSHFNTDDIKIICPLNYGNTKYSNEIAAYGKKLFSDRFIALQDFIDRDTYYSLMDEVDVAVMPHNRGQAGGNIIAFLKKGIKVYMKPKSSIYKLLKALEMPVFTIDELLKSSIEELKKELPESQVEKSLKILNASIGSEEKRFLGLKKILLNE